MHSFTDPNKYIEAVTTELAKTHTWNRKLPEAWLLYLMNEIKASPTRAAFLLATTYLTIRPKEPTPKLADRLAQECRKRCTVSQGQIQATVAEVLTSGNQTFVIVQFQQKIPLLQPQDVKKIAPQIHPKRLKDIGCDLTLFPTAVTLGDHHGAELVRQQRTQLFAFTREFTVTWHKTQNVLDTVELVKENITSLFGEVNSAFKQLEKTLQTQKKTFATELATALAAAEAVKSLETDPDQEPQAEELPQDQPNTNP